MENKELYYGEITMNSKGFWTTILKDSDDKYVGMLEWTTKAGLKAKLKELGAKWWKTLARIFAMSVMAKGLH